jgi:signal transduction histidine kinase/CheY-like chemotaxis protein
MPSPLNILIVEDSPDDAEMVVAELRRAGFNPTWKRVETESDFLAGIQTRPDIILSDYSMPQFTGLRAAELLRKSSLDIPFILISGTVGEDVAVEAMKHGATDYLLKDRITRLGSAVDQALAQKQLRDEHRETEEELRWKTAFLEAQVDSSPDGLLVVDSNGKKILQNQRMNEIFDIPQHIAESPDDETQIQFVASQIKNPAQFTSRVRHLYAHPDEIGRDEIELTNGIILDRYSAPVRDKAGKYYGRIWAFRDITENRRLEEQFRQSQKMEAIGMLSSGIAHDFNNILGIILMQVGLLREEHDLTLLAEHAQEIEKAAQRAADLTRQLLLFSRRQVAQPRDLDLNELTRNLSKMLRRALSEDIHLQLNYSPVPLIVRADPGMLDQVLLNLSVNARDAMTKGGRLIIDVSMMVFDAANVLQSPRARTGAFACLAVTDSGCGIPADIKPRIFDPFFTTKGVGKGTGLGLATVFGIVQQHQGWIDVHSDVGLGTIFRIYLPLSTSASAAEYPLAGAHSVPGGNETVLVVEDEPQLRALIRQTLSRLGYKVIEAEHGPKALDLWRKNKSEIRLLITDMVMPGGMSGRELARQLLAERPELKIIYTSGYSPDLFDKDFEIREGDNFLAKPFQVQRFAETVRHRLDAAD